MARPPDASNLSNLVQPLKHRLDAIGGPKNGPASNLSYLGGRFRSLPNLAPNSPFLLKRLDRLDRLDRAQEFKELRVSNLPDEVGQERHKVGHRAVAVSLECLSANQLMEAEWPR